MSKDIAISGVQYVQMYMNVLISLVMEALVDVNI